MASVDAEGSAAPAVSLDMVAGLRLAFTQPGGSSHSISLTPTSSLQAAAMARAEALAARADLGLLEKQERHREIAP